MATDLNPMSDQDRISPDKNQYSIKQTKDENKKINYRITIWSNRKF